MKKYCKAYHLKDLHLFPGWKESPGEGETELPEDTVVYLWDDLTVVKSPVTLEEGILWNAITLDWQEFCHKKLQFDIPEDLRYAFK